MLQSAAISLLLFTLYRFQDLLRLGANGGFIGKGAKLRGEPVRKPLLNARLGPGLKRVRHQKALGERTCQVDQSRLPIIKSPSTASLYWDRRCSRREHG